MSASVIRDFRGAMVGRADKGLILTTGTFTREAKAKAEAIRDGAPTLDLIDGVEFVQMLKNFRLGICVTQKIIEEESVDSAWFQKY